MSVYDPMDCSLPGSLSIKLSQQEYWCGLPFPSPGYLLNPGIEPGSPALQADFLPSEPSRKPLVHISRFVHVAVNGIISVFYFLELM